MKPSVLILALAMASASALAISASFCGVLNTQRRLSSTGSTILALAATLIIGTLASAATSTMASEPGVIEVPTNTSTLSRSEEHTSELQSLMRISYAVFCLKKKKHRNHINTHTNNLKTTL